MKADAQVTRNEVLENEETIRKLRKLKAESWARMEEKRAERDQWIKYVLENEHHAFEDETLQTQTSNTSN